LAPSIPSLREETDNHWEGGGDFFIQEDEMLGMLHSKAELNVTNKVNGKLAVLNAGDILFIPAYYLHMVYSKPAIDTHLKRVMITSLICASAEIISHLFPG
jgi:hypothetical protein